MKLEELNKEIIGKKVKKRGSNIELIVRDYCRPCRWVSVVDSNERIKINLVDLIK